MRYTTQCALQCIITPVNAFNINPALVVHLLYSLGSILARRHFTGAHMPHQATNNVPILPGTHSYTWVESSNVDKVSCWQTKVRGADGNQIPIPLIQSQWFSPIQHGTSTIIRIRPHNPVGKKYCCPPSHTRELLPLLYEKWSNLVHTWGEILAIFFCSGGGREDHATPPPPLATGLFTIIMQLFCYIAQTSPVLKMRRGTRLRRASQRTRTRRRRRREGSSTGWRTSSGTSSPATRRRRMLQVRSSCLVAEGH